MTVWLRNTSDRAAFLLLIGGDRLDLNPGAIAEWNQSQSESILWADTVEPCSLSYKRLTNGDGEIRILPVNGQPERRHITSLFRDYAINAANPDVDYIPFICSNGRVGYQVRAAGNSLNDGEILNWIYFNPSQDTDDGEPNVFVYIGKQNDPAQDEAQHWYGVRQIVADYTVHPDPNFDPDKDGCTSQDPDHIREYHAEGY